jgi:hypothetical protein
MPDLGCSAIGRKEAGVCNLLMAQTILHNINNITEKFEVLRMNSVNNIYYLFEMKYQ